MTSQMGSAKSATFATGTKREPPLKDSGATTVTTVTCSLSLCILRLSVTPLSAVGTQNNGLTITVELFRGTNCFGRAVHQ